MKTTGQMSIWERLIAPMPAFFKKLSYLGAFLVVITTPIIAVETPIPQQLKTIAGYVFTIGTVMVAVSKFTVDHDSAPAVTTTTTTTY